MYMMSGFSGFKAKDNVWTFLVFAVGILIFVCTFKYGPFTLAVTTNP